MRTTLDLDDDVLQAAKEIAAAKGLTAGKVVSDLVRKALEPVARRAPKRRAADAPAGGWNTEDDDGARQRAPRRAVSGPALLDVNVLVALFNPNHIHHDTAHDWFAENHTDGWATCPITEQGVIRILANPKYWSEFERTSALVDRLATFCSSRHHHFWSDTVSLRDATLFNLSHISGHRQLTDVYLLGLARKMKGGWRHSIGRFRSRL